MTTREEWQALVGRSWAENYRLTDRAFSGLTQRLLERIAEHAGHSVLDVGCGAGELALAIARARPGARIVGVDVSPELVAAAQHRGESHGNASFVHADAAAWRDPGFVPDVVVSRHGVMFFDDPAAAFANLHGQASDAAEMVFSCFRGLEENPWASELARLLELPASSDHTAPGPFAFADPRHVEDRLTAGGWHDVAFEPANFAYIAGKGEDPVEDALQMFHRIGPAAPALRALEGEALARAEGWIRDWLDEHRSGDLVAFPAAAWIVTARH